MDTEGWLSSSFGESKVTLGFSTAQWRVPNPDVVLESIALALESVSGSASNETIWEPVHINICRSTALFFNS